jgi:protein-S-isoprenylcysteine O-methyltransferase Ste14
MRMKVEQGAAPGAQVGVGPSQAMRKGVIVVSIILSLGFLSVATSYWPDGHIIHESIEWTGVALIILCMLGRTWCTLYIGGRKNHALVADGPYSICRNPLYTFSIIGAVGVGAQFGSLGSAFVVGLFTYIVFARTATREEKSMAAAFGDRYRAYAARVPRFVPNFSLWSSPETIPVRPRVMLTTLADAAVFFVAIPVVETFEYLHETGVLQTYFTLP